MMNVLVKLIRYLYFHTFMLLGLVLAKFEESKLRKKLVKALTLEDLIDLAFSLKFIPLLPTKPSFNPFSIQPTQDKEEISQLLRILVKRKPKIVLEIGTSRGGTLFLFSRVAAPDANLISIDLPEGPFGGGYPIWKIPFYGSFALANQKIHLLRMNSHNETTLRELESTLDGLDVDFLFIDGDHSYEGVKKDFQMYSELVKPGGIIAFHDIVPHSSKIGLGVDSFWLEIRDKYKHLEIVKDPDQRKFGIGVIFK